MTVAAVQGTLYSVDPRTQDLGTQGLGDPGTQIGMHCACMYGNLELW